MLKGHMDEISGKLESVVPRSSAEAAHNIRDISGITFRLAWTREIMRHCGFRFIKTQPIPGRDCSEKQAEWISALQPVIDEEAYEYPISHVSGIFIPYQHLIHSFIMQTFRIISLYPHTLCE